MHLLLSDTPAIDACTRCGERFMHTRLIVASDAGAGPAICPPCARREGGHGRLLAEQALSDVVANQLRHLAATATPRPAPRNRATPPRAAQAQAPTRGATWQATHPGDPWRTGHYR
jgi:hypothetical protein